MEQMEERSPQRAEAVALARRKKDQSRRAFDKQATGYDAHLGGEHARKLYPQMVREVERIARAHVSAAAGRCVGCHRISAPAQGSPLRVLDVGCGTGALSELVLNAVPGCRLTGVDISTEMLRQARARLQGAATFVPGDAEHLPFSEGTYDVVLINDAFHHFPEPRRAAFEAWRVLTAGGILLIGDEWRPQPLRALSNAMLPLWQEGDVRIYSEQEMRGLLSGWFSAVEWRQVAADACVVVAQK